jgi:ABC-2 type transport system permease protein
MTVLFSSIFSGMGLLWDRQFGFLKETLVAPVPRLQVMLGRTLGAATVAMCQGLLVAIVCFVVGFRVADPTALPVALLFMALIACLFSALGTAIGSVLQNIQGFQLIMNFLVMPIFFLSGALYPLNNLPGVLSLVTRLDPLAYGVDGLRTTLMGASHFGLAADGSVLVVVTLMLLFIGSYLFSKIQV